METVPHWRALQQMVGKVPRQVRTHSTTLYANPAQIEHWCASGNVRALVADNAVLVVRTDQGFDRIYHVSKDVSALKSALTELPAGRYVADLIGRDGLLDELSAAYVACGFHPHAFLRRMTRAKTLEAASYAQAVFARPDEAEEIAAFLKRLLDPLSEQLPTIDELRVAAQQDRLLIVRGAAALSGMLMYDIQGQLAHLRFWHVHPNAQGSGVGRSLMGAFLSAAAGAHRIVLWVIGDNERSIAIYRHYGFEVDGLIDRIMVSNKDGTNE